jgi:hypothetical protein
MWFTGVLSLLFFLYFYKKLYFKKL